MSDMIVKAVDLSKIYRLYTKPHHRFLDMFGLLRQKAGAYTEHHALDHVNLEIRRGERVAFIGRNGAGKSTLLKLATNVIEPTSGTIVVSEGVSALLQIGAGFHPDFTGRENAYSYLAHLGITGHEAKEKVAELIEFAELEEYIDQPIKTYSTGMVARLMFSTSTTISPKLLVLDEILGVGDAYFSQKSSDRIKELCDRSGTTILLVSHDIYASSRLCERMIWLDAGRVVIDGPSVQVIKAYENSIRVQEESRLRKKLRQRLSSESSAVQSRTWILELRTPGNIPLSWPVYFHRISLAMGGIEQGVLPLFQDQGAQDPLTSTEILALDGCWGDVAQVAGQMARPMLNYGSTSHLVRGAFLLPEISFSQQKQEFTVSIEYFSEEGGSLRCYLFPPDGSPQDLGEFQLNSGNWTKISLSQAQANPSPQIALSDLGQASASGRHGSARVAITDVRVFDENSRPVFSLTQGRPATLAIKFKIRDSTVCEKCQVLLAFMRNGVEDACRVMTRDIVFDFVQRPQGIIFLHLERLPLGTGKYAVTVMLAAEGYYERNPSTFYTLNAEVYDCHNRLLEISVILGESAAAAGTGFLLDGPISPGWIVTDDKEHVNLQAIPALAGAPRLAEFRDICYCPSWHMGLDERRGGRFLKERLALFEELGRLAVDTASTFDWVNGLKLALPLKGDIARALYVGGSYEPNELAFLHEYVRPGMTVVDGGANIGIFTIFLARLVGPQGRVLSFEPSSRELARLRENININQFQNVTVYAEGLHESSGTLTLNIAKAELAGHNTFEDLDYTLPIPVIRVKFGTNEPQWISAWNGEREFVERGANCIEIYIYSEGEFHYQINGLHQTSSSTMGPLDSDTETVPQSLIALFPSWEVSHSETLQIEIDNSVKIHGNKGDYLRLFRRIEPTEETAFKLAGAPLPATPEVIERVNVRQLDQVVSASKISRIDLIKLDIEGYESRALRGALNTIRRDKPTLLLEVSAEHRPDTYQEVMDFLKDLNYHVFEFNPATGQLRRVAGPKPCSPNVVAMCASCAPTLIQLSI